MKTKGTIFTMIVALIEKVYSFLWGDLIHIPLPGGGSVGISLLIILLIPTGIYFTVRTRLLPVRMFPDMIKALTGKKENKDSLSTFQTLIVSTATRVGMGNLVGVVAAITRSRIHCTQAIVEVRRITYTITLRINQAKRKNMLL